MIPDEVGDDGVGTTSVKLVPGAAGGAGNGVFSADIVDHANTRLSSSRL